LAHAFFRLSSVSVPLAMPRQHVYIRRLPPTNVVWHTPTPPSLPLPVLLFAVPQRSGGICGYSCPADYFTSLPLTTTPRLKDTFLNRSEE
jgi:hypothetical protein